MQSRTLNTNYNYHAFGSSMAGRSFSNSSYKYGFNGMEKFNETANDNYDFGARIYDSRIGRWLAVDRHFYNYRAFSPYNFTLNNPIIFTDPNGKDIKPTIKPDQQHDGAIKCLGDLARTKLSISFTFNTETNAYDLIADIYITYHAELETVLSESNNSPYKNSIKLWVNTHEKVHVERNMLAVQTLFEMDINGKGFIGKADEIATKSTQELRDNKVKLKDDYEKNEADLDQKFTLDEKKLDPKDTKARNELEIALIVAKQAAYTEYQNGKNKIDMEIQSIEKQILNEIENNNDKLNNHYNSLILLGVVDETYDKLASLKNKDNTNLINTAIEYQKGLKNVTHNNEQLPNCPEKK